MPSPMVSCCIAPFLVLAWFTLPSTGHDMMMSDSSQSLLRSQPLPRSERISFAASDNKRYALFTLPDIDFVNNTWDINWGYSLPKEGKVLANKEGRPLVSWHALDLQPVTAADHPSPYTKSGLALVNMLEYFERAGVATNPRQGDTSATGGWRSHEIEEAVASMVSNERLKDQFGQPVELDACTGPNSAVRVVDAAYRDTDDTNLCTFPTVCSDGVEGVKKKARQFHVSWVHTDRYETTGAHVLEWNLQWDEDRVKALGHGCNGGFVNGTVVCGDLLDESDFTTSTGPTSSDAFSLNRNACYETQMHNVWVSLGSRNTSNLDQTPSPITARHFAVHADEQKHFNQCSNEFGAPMMSGTCRSLTAKQEPLSSGKWWYKPHTAFGEAFVFRGSTGNPHVTPTAQHHEKHRESVDFRLICVKKLAQCPPMRQLNLSGRYAPASPTDKRVDSVCTP